MRQNFSPFNEEIFVQFDISIRQAVINARHLISSSVGKRRMKNIFIEFLVTNYEFNSPRKKFLLTEYWFGRPNENIRELWNSLNFTANAIFITYFWR